MRFHSYSRNKRHDAPRSKHLPELLLSTSNFAGGGRKHDSPMKNREICSPKDAYFAKVGLDVIITVDKNKIGDTVIEKLIDHAANGRDGEHG